MTRKISFAGVVAALYAALTISLGFISYGPIQFRIAEVLCILPFFFPFSVWGLFVGCLIANIASPYPLDLVVGPIATLIAALATMRVGMLKRDGVPIKALACLPPVVVNAVLIGALIAYYTTGAGDAEAFALAFAVGGFQVGFGQLVVLYVIGLPLMVYLPKSQMHQKLSELYMR